MKLTGLKFFGSTTCVSAVAAAIILSACGKSESSDPATTATPTTTTGSGGTTDSPGVTAAAGNDIVMSGQLALSALGLTASEKGVISFKMSRGEVQKSTKLTVDANGKFSATISKADEAVNYLAEQVKLARDARNWDQMLVYVKEVAGSNVQDWTVDDLKNMQEEQLQEGVGGLVDELKDAGFMTLLVAYDVSGNPEAEASSFRFIGSETAGGRVLTGFPNDKIKGNVNFGQITGSGVDVKSEVKAGDAVNVSAEALESYADLSKTLKAVKNGWMNTKWRVEPFYFWKSNVPAASVIDAMSDVSLNTYQGYGFYVPSEGDQGLTHADVCGGKSVKFIPPAAVTLKRDSSPETTVTEFTNAGTTPDPADKTCDGGSDYYARQDERDGKISYMLNFGTGGSIQNSPEGLWRMKIDDVEVGRYDLAAASPIKDGKPLVYIPSAKFVSSGGNIVSVEVQLHRWNGTAYEVVTDLEPVKRLITEFSASINNDDSMTRLTIGDDGKITGQFDSSDSEEGQVRNPPVAVSALTSAGFAVYYKIGTTNYRIEFR
jgi:hypothetical protein